MRDIELSLVVPALNEVDNITTLIPALCKICTDLAVTYEIVLVDDGSVDGTYDVARALVKTHPALRPLRLSRNFGHQAALLAGLHRARGRAVITMDADLQHPPELVPELLRAWRAGNQVVHTVRRDSARSGSPLKRLSSWLFYRLLSAQSGLPIQAGMADFRLIDHKVLRHVLDASEANLFLRGMLVWVGFKQTQVPYDPAPRLRGASRYTYGHMLRFAAHGIVSFSEKPLYWAFRLGLAISAFALAYGVYAVLMWRFNAKTIPGWTSLAVLLSLMSGLQFVFIGLLGAYLGAVYAEVKNRPPYIVAEEADAEDARQSAGSTAGDGDGPGKGNERP